MSQIDNLTFKCMDSNRGDVSYNFNKDTYFHQIILYLQWFSVTDDSTWYSLSTGKRLVERSNDNWPLRYDWEKKPVESDIVQSQQQQLQQQQLVYVLWESLWVISLLSMLE